MSEGPAMEEVRCSQSRKVPSGIERCELSKSLPLCTCVTITPLSVSFRRHYSVDNDYIALWKDVHSHNVIQYDCMMHTRYTATSICLFYSMQPRKKPKNWYKSLTQVATYNTLAIDYRNTQWSQTLVSNAECLSSTHHANHNAIMHSILIHLQ